MSGELAVITPQPVATLETFALDVERILARKKGIQNIMEKVMQDNEHYGLIPGCGKKKSLFKPGAEALASTFQLCPKYQITKTPLENGHREYEIVCDLHNPAGGFIGSGVGSASTMEGKYRFRVGDGEITAVPVPKAYWGNRTMKILKDAANAAGIEGDKFGTKKDESGAWMISTQATENRVEHDNPADYYNTVLKMAKKRAFVDAVLTTTGASDIFTQDIEDMPEIFPQSEAPKKGTPQKAPTATSVKAELDKLTTEAALTTHWEKNAKGYPSNPEYEAIKNVYAVRMAEVKSPAAAPPAGDRIIHCPDKKRDVRETECGKCAAREGCPEWPE